MTESSKQFATNGEVARVLRVYAESFASDTEGLHLLPEAWNTLRKNIALAASAISPARPKQALHNTVCEKCGARVQSIMGECRKTGCEYFASAPSETVTHPPVTHTHGPCPDPANCPEAQALAIKHANENPKTTFFPGVYSTNDKRQFQALDLSPPAIEPKTAFLVNGDGAITGVSLIHQEPLVATPPSATRRSSVILRLQRIQERLAAPAHLVDRHAIYDEVKAAIEELQTSSGRA